MNLHPINISIVVLGICQVVAVLGPLRWTPWVDYIWRILDNEIAIIYVCLAGSLVSWVVF